MKALSEYRKLSIQAKAAIWFTICNFFQKGISFITVPIFTRMMNAEQYGVYSLYLSWFQILTIITSLNLYCGVLDNGMSKFEKERDKYISAMQGLTVTITTILFCIYLIRVEFWSDILGLAHVYIMLMFIEMFVNPAIQFWFGRQRFEYAYKKLVIVTVIRSVLNPLLGFILVIFFSDKSLGRVCSVVITELFICGFILLYQFYKGKVFFDKKYWSYALKLAIPMVPHYFAGMILNQGDRIMIEHMIGTSEVALYSVAYSIGMILQLFTGAINSVITPWIYEKFKNNNVDGVKNKVNELLLMVVFIAMCVMLTTPEIIMVFGSDEYISAVYVIPPIVASVFYMFLYCIFTMPQFYYEKTGFMMISSIGAAIINILLNLVFINKYGFVAAAYTTLVCYILYSVGHYLISQRIMNRYLKCKEPIFDVSKILLISILLLIVVVGVNFIFEYILIRYLILLSMVIGLIIKKEKIIGLIKRL